MSVCCECDYFSRWLCWVPDLGESTKFMLLAKRFEPITKVEFGDRTVDYRIKWNRQRLKKMCLFLSLSVCLRLSVFMVGWKLSVLYYFITSLCHLDKEDRRKKRCVCVGGGGGDVYDNVNDDNDKDNDDDDDLTIILVKNTEITTSNRGILSTFSYNTFPPPPVANYSVSRPSRVHKRNGERRCR